MTLQQVLLELSEDMDDSEKKWDLLVQWKFLQIQTSTPALIHPCPHQCFFPLAILSFGFSTVYLLYIHKLYDYEEGDKVGRLKYL